MGHGQGRRTSRDERRAAPPDVEGRGGQPVSAALDKVVLVETPDSIIVYTASDRLIAGSIVARDYSDRRNFMLRILDSDRRTAEQVAWHLELVKPGD